jgi:hypothetical protein
MSVPIRGAVVARIVKPSLPADNDNKRAEYCSNVSVAIGPLASVVRVPGGTANALLHQLT